MPSDEWRKARDQQIARRAAKEFAANGKVISYDSVYSDPTQPVINERGQKRKSATSAKPASRRFALSATDISFVAWINTLVDSARDKGLRVSLISGLPTPQDQRLIIVLQHALSSRNRNVVDYPKLARAFILLGSEAIHDLGRQLESKNPLVQMNAARTLRLIGAFDRITMIRLERLAESKHPDVRASCREALDTLRHTSRALKKVSLRAANVPPLKKRQPTRVPRRHRKNR